MLTKKYENKDFFNRIREITLEILDKPEKSDITYDILDPFLENELQLNVLKVKQKQMKYGKIWESVIGEYKNFIRLKEGHEFGFDLMNNRRKIVIELKNRYNTDNSSSKSKKYDQLSTFKESNPDYKCVYGVINDKNPEGRCVKINHNDQEILYISGDKLFTLIFGEDKDRVIRTVKKAVSDYTYGKI